MVQFRYQGRAASGDTVEGTIDAESRQQALRQLSASGLFPSSLVAGTKPGNGSSLPVALPTPARQETTTQAPASVDVTAGAASTDTRSQLAVRIKRKEITAFTRELATLLGAAIPIPSALEGLGAEEEGEAMRAVVLDLLARVRRGESLSQSMAAYPRCFPSFYTSMVEVGEEAGQLDKVLVDLADLLEQEEETRGAVLTAVAYPLFVLALGILTTFVLLAFVLPRLFEMLGGMTDVLPLPTQILLTISDFFQQYWLYTLIIAGALVVGIRGGLRSDSGAMLWDTMKIQLPLLGPSFRASAVGRFTRMLGILLRSGVSLLPGLEIVRKTVGNRFIAQHLGEVAEETRGGDSLAGPLRRTELFPSTLVKMIAVGEETGRLDEMLLRVAAIQDRQLRERSRTLISLLAPLLILIVGGVIGFIVIALLLPIFQMSRGL